MRLLALPILSAVLVLSTGCPKSGHTPMLPGESGRTVLLFADDCGGLLGRDIRVSGLVLGGQLTDSRLLQPRTDGSVTLDLLPGTYTVRAYLHQRGAEPREIQRVITIPQTLSGRTFALSLTPPELAEAWSLFRDKRYAEARTFLLSLRAQPAFSSNPAVDNALGWVSARLADLGQATAFFETAQGSGCTGSDALVGLAGVQLLSGSELSNAQSAERLLTEVLGRPAEYRSAPQHDTLGPVDLRVCRAFARWLQGDLAGTRADLTAVEGLISTDATPASQDLFNTLQMFLDS